MPKTKLTRGDAPSWRRVRRELLVPAFKKLRARGIFARHTHLSCCGSCATGELEELADEYVGYHIQSVPDALDDPFESIYLLHQLDVDTKPFVRKTFVDAGLVVDWDGSDDDTILVALAHPAGHWWSVVRRAWRLRALCEFWRECTAHLHAPGGAYYAALEAEHESGPSPLPPPGVTPAFEAVCFDRCVLFERPDDDPTRYVAMLDTDSHEEQQLKWCLAGQPIEELFLGPPEVFEEGEGCEDGGEFRELKGAELDAAAFVGDSLALRSYERVDDWKSGNDWIRIEMEAPLHSGQRYFTIAELHRALEPLILWLTQCEAYAEKWSGDHCFFEGLQLHDDGTYTMRWGS